MRRETVRGVDHYLMMSASEICDAARDNMQWMRYQEKIQSGNGAMSTEKFLQLASTGDETLVEQSEKLLAQIEDQVPMSRGWRNVEDVVGAVPNIPAFLAGHPQHMRRRERTMRDTAPLTIYADLSSSMGISQDKILRRGIAILALVRQLVEHRPVELWVGSSLGDGGVTASAAWRIDTTPLDLARAAFHIAHPAMSRLFGYAMCEQQVNKHLGGYGGGAKDLQAIAGWDEVLHIPRIHVTDPMVDDPVGWIKGVLRKYTQGEEAAA